MCAINYERRQDAWLDSLPFCTLCDQQIQDREYFKIKGQCYCKGCIEECEEENENGVL